MPNYSTIMEKAVEWNISARHIQHLCRTGKIRDAVKRAGAWSIPDDTPNPGKNTKTSDGCFVFVGTKSKIFNCAIDLFTKNGFDNVSLRDISSRAGIRQTTVYSHFKTKRELLDSIYDFYCHNYFKGRMSLKDIESLILKESLATIMECVRYGFKSAHKQCMLDISKLVFQRIGIDERASKIAGALLDEGVKYAEDAFNLGVKIGRFAPFDTHAIAVLINSAGIYRFCDLAFGLPPGDIKKFADDERRLHKYVAGFIEDAGPIYVA